MNVITGLPRTGSTLLCNVLNQHPKFYATSTSILPMICASIVSLSSNTDETKGRLNADKDKEIDRALRSIRAFCYQWNWREGKEIVFDKSRFWVHNINLLRNINPHAKVIVTVRDLRNIFASVEKQYRHRAIFDPSTNPQAKQIAVRADDMFSDKGLIGGPLAGIKDMLDRNLPNVFWMKYEDLADRPEEIMRMMYDYFGIPYFNGHDYEDVKNTSEDVDGNYLLMYPHEGNGKVELTPLDEYKHYMSPFIHEQIYDRYQWYNETFGYPREPIKVKDTENIFTYTT